VLNAACRIRWCLTGPFACPLAKACRRPRITGCRQACRGLLWTYPWTINATDLAALISRGGCGGAKLGDMQVTQSRCPTTADAPAKLT
jgi:hypothetical protein